MNAAVVQATNSSAADASVQIRMIPFADAGVSGSLYEVWLPLRSTP
jgi:hypothetical protein